MLIWMREGTGAGFIKYILLGLLLMAVAGLVLMDVGGFFTSNIGNGKLVKGAGVNISSVEFDRTVRRALSTQGMTPQEALKLGLINKLLESEIQNRLFVQETRKLGLEISDDAVKAQIAKLAAPLATEGRSKKDALQQVLRTQGISEGEFVSAIRQEMASGLLRNVLQPPATLASPLLAQNLYRYDNEKRAAKIIILSNDSVSDVTKPTEENLKKYYDANKSDYLIPENRTVTMATLKSDMLKKNMVISDADLKGEYDKNIASFTKPSRRTIEQAVVSTEEDAKKIVANMTAGKSLKDSSGADSYIAAQDYEESAMMPEMAKPVFAASENTPVGPIKTSLGWHVVVVTKTLPAVVAPFADVKDKLKSELEQAGMSDQMFQAANTIEDRIAGGDKLADLVNEYGMTTEIIGPFRRNGLGSNGNDVFKSYAADREKLIEAAYDYNEGEVTNLIETADGQFHIIQIDQVILDSYRDLKSVHAEIEKRWLDEQKTLTNRTKAKAILDALNGGKSLEDVARENNASIRTFDNINRQEAPPAPLTPIVSAQIFSTDTGKNFSSELENGFAVGQVTNVTMPPAIAKDSEQLKTLQDLVARSQGQDILSQYIVHLGNGKKIRINQAQLEQTYATPQGGTQ